MLNWKSDMLSVVKTLPESLSCLPSRLYHDTHHNTCNAKKHTFLQLLPPWSLPCFLWGSLHQLKVCMLETCYSLTAGHQASDSSATPVYLGISIVLAKGCPLALQPELNLIEMVWQVNVKHELIVFWIPHWKCSFIQRTQYLDQSPERSGHGDSAGST